METDGGPLAAMVLNESNLVDLYLKMITKGPFLPNLDFNPGQPF